MPTKHFWVGLWCVMLTFTIMAQDISTTKADAPPLAARGPYDVGVRTLQLTDAARSRPLTLEVWYPAQESDTATFYDAIIGKTPVRISGRAKRDAAPEDGPFPLIVASHGQPGTRHQLAYLGEHLASRGFVVVSIEHTGSTYADTTQLDYVASLVYRPEDILFVIDALPEYLSSADNTNVGLLGYSYGGYSVINAVGVGLDGDALRDYCQTNWGEGPCFALPFFGPLESARGASVVRADPRIKALFVMAPYGQPWLGAESLARLQVPFFVAVGDEDDVALYERDGLEYFRRAGSAHKYLLTLVGAGHKPFAECPQEARDTENCFDPVWDQNYAHDVTKHFASAFFGRFLQGSGRAGQYLDADLPGFEPNAPFEVTLEVGQ